MGRPPTCLCGYCKKCKKRITDRVYYERNRETLIQKSKDHYHANLEQQRAWFRSYRKAKKDDAEWQQRQNEVKKKWAEQTDYDLSRDKKKVFARRKVQDLVARGKLARGDCEVCGAPEAHAHHDDYSKPLDVRWFCVQHHADHHRLSRCG